MKRTLITIAFVLAAFVLHGEDITTLSGKKYQNITVTRVEPNGISISHDEGLAKIPFADLSNEQRTKYGYDPKKAAQFDASTQAAATQQQAAANAAAVSRNQLEQDRKTAKWIVGRVQRVQDNGVLIQPPPEHGRVNTISWAEQFGVTDLALERFKREKSSLPADFQAYLAKGGDFFGSVTGMQYIAANWIKTASDYQKYFALEKLYQSKDSQKSLAAVPPVDTDQLIFVRLSAPLGAVDGDYVSLWIVPDEAAHSEGGRTFKGYRLLGNK